MKKFLIAVASILGILVLAGAASVFYITSGLDSGKNLTVNPITLAEINDGTYIGTYQGGRWSNEVKVTVSHQQITQINVIKTVTFEKPEVTDALINEVIARQNTNVDIISGATVTSKAYLKSIENALSQ